MNLKNKYMNTTTTILNHNQIGQKIKRMAYQIYEANFNYKTLYVVGIAKSGVLYAKSIIAVLEEISDLKIHFIQLEINKKNPHLPIKTSESVWTTR